MFQNHQTKYSQMVCISFSRKSWIKNTMSGTKSNERNRNKHFTGMKKFVLSHLMKIK